MPFQKGHKHGKGRPAGSSNKASTKIRESFTKLLEDALPQLKKDFKDLEAKDRIRLYLDLSKYVVPQLKQTEINANVENKNINFSITDLYNNDKEA